jgi:hypothetical protein
LQRVTAHIWRILLSESRELIDELLERGIVPEPTHIVDSVLAAHPSLRELHTFRGPLLEEVANYLENEAAA